jgi:hypothetical protein
VDICIYDTEGASSAALGSPKASVDQLAHDSGTDKFGRAGNEYSHIKTLFLV